MAGKDIDYNFLNLPGPLAKSFGGQEDRYRHSPLRKSFGWPMSIQKPVKSKAYIC